MGRGNPTNPYIGLKGFWNRWNRFTYTFSGAADVGIGRGKVEAPYAPPLEPRCPVCDRLMSEHQIERGTATVPTRLHCPG
ncbi:MAG: hypothetical protein JWR33_1262 [Naasia sp.]|uniref:hypothetical protein n=1 Tax=Naasia sp. TaxID=2546198 RepID=UPI00261AA70A|nr:hypothetical protein [Naasia sp.]MCU1570521.1 hypothetical protein [Naasia sp.]